MGEGMGKGAAKGLTHVGCKGGKGSLMKFFAWGAACCDPKHIGFSDNMPKYKNSGTTGRFKANRGAGSICGMVKSLAAGVSAGDDGWGMLVQEGQEGHVGHHRRL